MNQFNALHGNEPTDPPRDWSSQPPEAHFKSRTSPPRTSPVVSDIMGRLNHRAIDNGDVEVQPSDFLLNITLNMFQIQTPLRSNQLMMMKWAISWNYSTQNMMIILCMLTFRYYRIYWWLPFLLKIIQSLLCCFIKMEEQMLQSQIACHTFPCSSQPRPL